MFSRIKLSIIAVLVAVFAVVYTLDSHLESFYIFNPPQLHDLSTRAIAAHGNDTRSVVSYIVDELKASPAGSHINLQEEWIFNNAGARCFWLRLYSTIELIRGQAVLWVPCGLFTLVSSQSSCEVLDDQY